MTWLTTPGSLANRSVYSDMKCRLWQLAMKPKWPNSTISEKLYSGSVRPVDQNGDYVIDSDDRVVLGTAIPTSLRAGATASTL